MSLTAHQVAARQHGIGSSDAPTVAGVNPYKTALELFYEKTGEWEPLDLSDNEFVLWGTVLESAIADTWADRTGKRVQRSNRTLYAKAHRFMLAHIDRKVVGEHAALEVKCRTWRVAAHYGESGSADVLEIDTIQCQHQMAVTGYERVYLAVFLGVGDMRDYVIERDDDLISNLTLLEVDFWKRVESNTPPELDCAHRTAPDVLAKLYPGTDGTTIALPDEAVHWHQVLAQAAEKRKGYEQIEAGAKAHIRELMGEAAIGELEGGGFYTRKLQQRKGYTAEASESMMLRYHKPKGEFT